MDTAATLGLRALESAAVSLAASMSTDNLPDLNQEEEEEEEEEEAHDATGGA